MTYQQVYKSCGKGNCGTCGGTGLAHGPYWQLIEWDPASGGQRCSYVGVRLPAEILAAMALRHSAASRALRTPRKRRL